MSLIAVHLGVIDEEQIDNMSYIFFEDILEQLGHKLTYDAIVNYAGNSFCEKSWEMIVDHNPLQIADGGKMKRASQKMMDILNSSEVTVIKKGEKLPWEK